MPKFGATGAHKIHSYFSASGGVLSFYRDNASTQLAFGESDSGLDVRFYGDTVSAYVLWDESADTLLGASSATFNWLGTFTVSGGATFSGADTAINSTSIHIANATSDRVAFYGQTATVQQTYSTSAGDIAAALRNLGLMTS